MPFNIESAQESDDDSTYGSDNGSLGDSDAPCRISGAIVNTSTEVNVDSSEDEPDAYSSPMSEQGFVSSRDVGHLYRIYEDQHCQSYRPSAARPRPSAGAADGLPQVTSTTASQTPTAGKNTGRKQSKWK